MSHSAFRHHLGAGHFFIEETVRVLEGEKVNFNRVSKGPITRELMSALAISKNHGCIV